MAWQGRDVANEDCMLDVIEVGVKMVGSEYFSQQTQVGYLL